MNLYINEEDVSLLFVAAFRYALGRMSYMPSVIAGIILDNKELLTDWQRELFAREVHEHIDTFGNAGMDFDTKLWLNFADEMRGKNVTNDPEKPEENVAAWLDELSRLTDKINEYCDLREDAVLALGALAVEYERRAVETQLL